MAYTNEDIRCLVWNTDHWDEIGIPADMMKNGLTVTKFSPDGTITGLTSNAVISHTPVWVMVEDTCGLYVTIKVPAPATAIGGIKIYFYATALLSGDIFMRYSTAHWNTDTASAVETDTLAEAAYAVGSGLNHIVSIAIPAAAYNGLTNIDTDDIISLYIERLGADLLDTYGGNLQIFGVEFTFT